MSNTNWKTLKLTNSEFSAFFNSLKELNSQKTSIGWAVARTFHRNKSKYDEYSKVLVELVKQYSEKDEKGVPKQVPGRQPGNLFSFEYSSENENIVAERFSKLSQEVLDVEYYESSKEDVEEYLKTNPAPNDYLFLIGNIINDDKL